MKLISYFNRKLFPFEILTLVDMIMQKNHVDSTEFNLLTCENV